MFPISRKNGVAMMENRIAFRCTLFSQHGLKSDLFTVCVCNGFGFEMIKPTGLILSGIKLKQWHFSFWQRQRIYSRLLWSHAKPKWFKQKYQTEFDSVHLPGQLYKFDKYKICFENEYIDCLLAISLAEVMLLSCDIYSIRQYLCGKGKKVHTFPWKCIFVLQSEDEWALQRFRYHCNHWIPNH